MQDSGPVRVLMIPANPELQVGDIALVGELFGVIVDQDKDRAVFCFEGVCRVRKSKGAVIAVGQSVWVDIMDFKRGVFVRNSMAVATTKAIRLLGFSLEMADAEKDSVVIYCQGTNLTVISMGQVKFK